MKEYITVALTVLCLTVTRAEAKENKDAKISKKGKYIRLREGTNIYSVGDVVFHQVPDEFDGFRIMLREPKSKNPVQFKVKEAGIVTLAAEGEDATRLMEQGWVKVSEFSVKALESPPYECLILQKEFDVGEYSISSIEPRFGVRLITR